MLNEATITGTQHILNDSAQALYVHVDDVVVMGSSTSASDSLLSHIVAALVHIGFVISQIVHADDMTKTLGYEINRSAKCLHFPLTKTALLQTALQEQVNKQRVHVDTIASLVGIWLYGALLDRNLMSIPHTIFQFIHVHRGKVVYMVEVCKG